MHPMQVPSPPESGYAPLCPVCDYDIAAHEGVPTEAEGEFTADVACPECGFAVPAGGWVIEGSAKRRGAVPRKGVEVVGAILNTLLAGVWLLTRLGWQILPFPVPSTMVSVFVWFNGGAAAVFWYRVWRRMQQAKLNPRARVEGREIRWVASAAGLERIDRRSFLRPPKRASVPASRVHRVTGAWADAAVGSPSGRGLARRAVRLTAWEWQLDARGREVDIAARSLFVQADVDDRDGTDPHPSTLAAKVERSIGVGRVHGCSVPQLPLADSQARLRFFIILQSVCCGGALVAWHVFLVRWVTTASVPRGSALAEWVVLTLGIALVPLPLVYFGTLAVIRARRRRWVREQVGAARAQE